ncbi:LytTR family DNA-binding domain-containing protein [Gemella cuniculi]|uniref:LytTR family DNA-binding domain-containing protein n=1 Tax=Gemella cuniculi TaxID=150240 RepID=UPI000416B79A|nr:LytTR family DNA-binding domain-containing protein [Gemella cuniculi]
MKITIEIDPNLVNIELVIRTSGLNDNVQNIKATLEKSLAKTEKIIFYKNNVEFFIPLKDIIFFETDSNKIYAHSIDDFYEVKFKLYELEKIVPFYFCRVSKSTIVNLRAIYSLEKSFSGSSTASFFDSYKKIHISRHYYKIVKEKLKETR